MLDVQGFSTTLELYSSKMGHFHKCVHLVRDGESVSKWIIIQGVEKKMGLTDWIQYRKQPILSLQWPRGDATPADFSSFPRKWEDLLFETKVLAVDLSLEHLCKKTCFR